MPTWKLHVSFWRSVWRSNGSVDVQFHTWPRDVAVGRVVITAARCLYGDGPAGKRRRERGRKQALLLLLSVAGLPTAVFRSPSIHTIFLGYLADAILSSAHQHLSCFQCHSLGMISVCRSLWIVGINRGGEARRALFLWTLFGKRNVIPVAFPAVTFPTYNHDICQEKARNSCETPGTRINSACYVFINMWVSPSLCLVVFIAFNAHIHSAISAGWELKMESIRASFSIQDGWEGEREHRKPITFLLT